MTAVATVPVVVGGFEAETGLACEVELLVPAELGAPPDAATDALMRKLHDPKGWKYAMKPYATFDKNEADALAAAYDWYLGGHEMTWEQIPHGKVYVVTSRGYYYYVGA